jgi:hypothetical protein
MQKLKFPGSSFLITWIREVFLVPARVLQGSNQVTLDLGKAHPGKAAILALHRELIPPLLKVASPHNRSSRERDPAFDLSKSSHSRGGRWGSLPG